MKSTSPRPRWPMPVYHRLSRAAVLSSLLVFAGCEDGASPPPGTGTIDVDASTTFQTISGWEATADVGQVDFPQTFVPWRDAVLDSAAALGINRLRVAFPSGSETPVDYFTQYATGQISRSTWAAHRFAPENDNGDPDVMDAAGFHFGQVDFAIDHVVNPLRQRLAARGETLYVNLSFVHNTTSAAWDHKTDPEEYAEVVLAAFQHLDTKYGWTPDGLELILEPDVLTSWSGTEIGQVLVAASQRLSAAGYSTEFIGPSTAAMDAAVPRFDAMMAVSGAPQISELSYHRYHGVSTGALQQIASRAAARGIGTSMLEHIGSGYENLFEDLVVGMNRSWQQYTIAYPTQNDNGGALFRVDPSTNTVTLGARTKFLGQVFRYVRRLAVRVEATSSDSDLRPIAFINPGNDYVVVVDATGAKEISVSGLPAGTYGVTYTTTSAYGVARPDVTIGAGQLLVTSIPDAGLLTIYRR